MMRALVLWLPLSASSAFGQTPPAALLRVTVVDSTGGVIVGAKVTASSADETARATWS